MVGIVVPTMNRPEFVTRQLTYYADVGFRHTVYIGDSSEGVQLEQMEEAVRRFQERVNIIHLRLPGLDIAEAIQELLHHVSEPYAACTGDDDFLVPSALDRCAGFLDGHSDYSIAHGVAALCVTKPQGDRREVTGAGPYGQRAVEHPRGGDRLIDYLGSYFPVIFSVRRTQEFRRDMDSSLAITDIALRGEVLPCCLPVIRGQVKQLGCLYMVRQAHRGNYRLLDSYDWITSQGWLPSVHVFRGLLVEELARQDGISVEEAREVVKEAFWSYLAKGLSQKWETRYGQAATGYRQRLRRATRFVPGLRWTWSRLRSFLPGDNNQMSLPALLRRSSPYHADFMPIYRAITTRTVLTNDSP